MENVQPGDSFPLLSADNLNQVISATNKVNRSGNNIQTKHPKIQIIQSVRIFNQTGEDLNALSIVELGKVHIEYQENREMFRKCPVIKALKPGDANGTETYAVVTKSLENGSYGEAVINGILTVKINITDTTHHYAAAIDGDCTKLESANEGVFKILCHEKASCQTGEQWCGVYFPYATGGGSKIELVTVTSVSTAENTVYTKPVIVKSDTSEIPNFTTDDDVTAKPYIYLVQS